MDERADRQEYDRNMKERVCVSVYECVCVYVCVRVRVCVRE